MSEQIQNNTREQEVQDTSAGDTATNDVENTIPAVPEKGGTPDGHADTHNEQAPAGGLRPDAGTRTDEQERIARGEMEVLRSAVEIRSQERALLARLEYQNSSFWQGIGKKLGFVDDARVRDTAAEQELQAQRARYNDAVNLVHAIRAERIANLAPDEQRRMMEVITRDVFHEADRLYNAKTEAKATHFGIGKYMGPVGRFFQREDVRKICRRSAQVTAFGAMGLAIVAGGVGTLLRYAPRLAIAVGAQGPMVVAAAKVAGVASVGGGAALGGLVGYKLMNRRGRGVLRKDHDATQTTLLGGNAQRFRETDVSGIVAQRTQLRQKMDRNKKVAGAAGAVAGGAIGYMLSGGIYGDTHGSDDVTKQHGGAPEDGGEHDAKAETGAQPSTSDTGASADSASQKATAPQPPSQEAQQPAPAPTPEQVPAQDVKAESVIFDIARGDTMWGRISDHLTRNYPAFDQLTLAQKNIVIDHFEDQLQNLESSQNYAQLKEMGFTVSARVGHEDVDMIRPHDRIDMTSILGDKTEVQRIIDHTSGAQGASTHDVAAAAVQSQAAEASAGERVQQSAAEHTQSTTPAATNQAEAPTAAPAAAQTPTPESGAASAEGVSREQVHTPRSLSIPDAQEMSELDKATFESMLRNDAAWHIAQTAAVENKNAFDKWLVDVSHMEGMTPQNGETLEGYIARYNRLYEQHQGVLDAAHESVPQSSGAIDSLAARELATSVNPNALYDIRSIVAQPKFFGYAEGDVQFSEFMRETTVHAYAQTASSDIASAQWNTLHAGDRHGRAWILSATKIVAPEGEQEMMGAYIERFVRDPRGQDFEYARLLTESPRAVQDMQSRLEQAIFGATVPSGVLGQPVNLSHLPYERQQAIMKVLGDDIGITDLEKHTNAQLMHRIIGSGKAQSLVVFLRGA